MNQPVPRTSPDGTGGISQAAERWIDDELAQSFPASDPPSWTLGAAELTDPDQATPRRTP